MSTLSGGGGALPLDGRRQVDGATVHADDDLPGLGRLGGTGPTDIWLAGIYGEIFRSTGDGTWRAETTPANAEREPALGRHPERSLLRQLRRHHASPAEQRQLGRRDDAARRATSDIIHWIWGSGPNDVYAGTDKGRLLHSVGDGVWQDDGFNGASSSAASGAATPATSISRRATASITASRDARLSPTVADRRFPPRDGPWGLPRYRALRGSGYTRSRTVRRWLI